MKLFAGLGADVRYAVRNWRLRPGFTAVAMGVLALGVGANTAIFSVVNSVLLQPLPFPHAGRLTVVWETNPQQGVRREGPSGPDFYDWREQSRLFEDMAAVNLGTGTVTGLGEPQQLPAMRVTTNLFGVLGARAALGRVFAPADGHGGRRPLVVVSYPFWQRALGGDPQAVGKTVMLDLIPYRVIGVLGRDFWLPLQSDLFVPWPDDELRYQRGRLEHDLGVFGRLRPGATVAQAAAELNGVQARLRAAHPEMEGWSVTAAPLERVTVEYLRPALEVLFGAVVLVLLIASTNVANLLLARAVGRRQEVAVRTALGAGRWRLARQFVVESLALSAAAGALGTMLAWWGIPLVAALVPATVPIPDAAAEAVVRGISMDGRVLAFSLAVSAATGLLFGLAPALHAMRSSMVEGLKLGSRSVAGGRRRLREGLLAAQVALALVLLAGAGLMVKSYARLREANLGFRADHLLTMEMELPTDTRYRHDDEQSAFFERVLEAARGLPGVRSAAVTSVLPLHPQDARVGFLIENGPVLPAHERLQADWRRVSAGYFETMGIGLLRGRLLDRLDDRRDGAVLRGVIDEAFARRFFGASDPLGRRLVLGRSQVEIVGVVGNVKHVGAAREFRPTVYVSFQVIPADRMNLVLRTAGDPAGAAAAAKAAVWRIDRDQPIYRVETMEQVVAEAESAPRLTLRLLGVFAAAALALASFGIFGVVAYTVSLRKREIGIRMALGADSRLVRRLVVGQGMRTAGVGMAAGLAASLGATRLMAGVVYGVSASDPAVLALVCAVLGTAAVAASWLPAMRAGRIDPVVVLREE
jgi:putative ABC transport system permease protein